jgi:hypothetical protein
MSTEDEEQLPSRKVIGAPATIYLVYGDIEHDDTHQNLREGEVTWCEDRQYDSDVEYVRADISHARATQLHRWYYVRDDYTFRELPQNIEEAIAAMREEVASGYTYGMLCQPGVADVVHVRSIADWTSFEKRARRWLLQRLAAA